jgi:hypothetical protein
MRSTRPVSPMIALLAALCLAPACGDDSGVNGDGGDPNDGSGGTDDADPGLTDGAILNDGGIWLCPDPLGQQIPCACNDGADNDSDGQIDSADPGCSGPSDNNEDVVFTPGGTECTDGVDNEDPPDGLIDSQDPECTGPLDDDESSFATGIPGDNMDECHQDCWFDGDSGSGNDGCRWLLGCDPVAGAAYDCNLLDPASQNCTRQQTDACINFCRPLTPNGCDCFGCCDIYVDDVLHTVLLNSDCSVDDIRADNGECVSCTKTATCVNPCDPCEYCLGHEPEPDCVPTTIDGAPPSGCAEGQTPCDPNDPDGGTCAADEFCLTGCCVSVID